jgi:hypothetical protein
VSGRPFIGSEVEPGGRTGKGIKRSVVGRNYWPSGSVGRGNGRGEWGVKSGECEAISRRGGDTGAARARCSGGYVWSASSQARRKPGRAHTAVRGKGGGGLGRPEAKAQ